jgi:formylglycine-generating enzyme required for sulfatase activity
MYMSPEQADGLAVDFRSDLFSLGSVLYAMCTGRPPFRAPSPVAVLKRVCTEMPRPIREINPELPPWLEELVARLHAKAPADRFASAREVADLLARRLAELQHGGTPSAPGHAPSAKLPQEKTAPTPPPRPRRLRVLAAAVLLVLLVGLGLSEATGITNVRGTVLRLFSPQGENRRPPPRGRHGDADAGVVHLHDQPTFKNSIGMEFVIVPKGRSWLGGGKDRLGDKEVEIPADFYLGKYEVTQEEWEKVMGENPSFFSRKGTGRDAVKDISDADLKRFPVEVVSWDDCQIFVEKLNKLEKEAGWVYRLPKETEWEYACRGGPMSDKRDSAFHFYFARPTNTLSPEQANFKHDNGLKRTCKVGSYEANRLGLFDMHGNVAEWCDDAEGADRVLRNGGWHVDSGNCRAPFRFPLPPSRRHYAHGLRLARVPSGAPSPEAKTPPPDLTDAAAWERTVAALPAEEQVKAVAARLKDLNPGFDGKVTPTISGDVVSGLRFSTDQVTNIAPVRALARLTSLNVNGTQGKLADLSPLKGLPLTVLHCARTRVSDLSPLKGMPLKLLECVGTDVSDLTPLIGMPLGGLFCAGCSHLSDLTPLKEMRLNTLDLTLTGVTDLSPLRGLPLTSLDLHGATRVTDLSPLRGLPLEYLNLGGTTVTDLSPLEDMTALHTLILSRTRVSDLSMLKRLPLKTLRMDYTKVSDLAPLKGMPLKRLSLDTPTGQNADVLRSLKGLEEINGKPAADFWKAQEKE